MGESPYWKLERDRTKIVVLGAGNVATHLAITLDKIADVVQIWSRKIENARLLAHQLKDSQCISEFDLITKNADFYIVAVSDDAIAPTIEKIKDVQGVIAHTSGTFLLEDVRRIIESDNCGVFYPLQTFSKDAEVNITEIPFLIEGGNKITENKLLELANRISDKTFKVDSRTRSYIHLAAVFANNFANYNWILANKILRENTDFNLHLFQPLLSESLRKAMSLGPETAQTGPAKRGDYNTLESHIAKLDKDTAGVYRLLSDMIIKEFPNEKPNE